MLLNEYLDIVLEGVSNSAGLTKRYVCSQALDETLSGHVTTTEQEKRESISLRPVRILPTGFLVLSMIKGVSSFSFQFFIFIFSFIIIVYIYTFFFNARRPRKTFLERKKMTQKILIKHILCVQSAGTHYYSKQEK